MSEAVKEAVKKEKELGDYVMKRYESKLSKLEKEYGMDTEKFLQKFEEGKLGDDEDFFEWFALAEAKKHWQEKLEDLESAV